MLVDCGVDYVGFPLKLPVHKEDLSVDDARSIVERIGGARSIVITYLDNARDIRNLVEHVGARAVQLHGPVERVELSTLRAMMPELVVIKSVVVGRDVPSTRPTQGSAVLLSADAVDAFITDTFDPSTGAAGATGKTHDWEISRRIVQSSTRPVILAGGLTPLNVAQAIRAVRPAAVDSHTGVEDVRGRKSRTRVVRFIANARAAFESA
jgi:phosphoribosylanthranilate isomerase